jgi:hypothetical protein
MLGHARRALRRLARRSWRYDATLADAHAFVLCSRPMPTHSRRRSPPATRRRALELLAGSADDMTEAMLVAHGFTVEQMVDLCVAGLATATPERIVAGGRTIEVATMQITEAGRRALDHGQRVGARWIRTT